MDPQVKTFRGRTLEELLPRIRAELGPDAVVLRRREGLEGGVGGFFQRRFVEVEARGSTATDDDPEPRPRSDRATAEGLATPAVQALVAGAAPFADALTRAETEMGDRANDVLLALGRGGAGPTASVPVRSHVPSSPGLYGPQPKPPPSPAGFTAVVHPRLTPEEDSVPLETTPAADPPAARRELEPAAEEPPVTNHEPDPADEAPGPQPEPEPVDEAPTPQPEPEPVAEEPEPVEEPPEPEPEPAPEADAAPGPQADPDPEPAPNSGARGTMPDMEPMPEPAAAPDARATIPAADAEPAAAPAYGTPYDAAGNAHGAANANAAEHAHAVANAYGAGHAEHPPSAAQAGNAHGAGHAEHPPSAAHAGNAHLAAHAEPEATHAVANAHGAAYAAEPARGAMPDPAPAPFTAPRVPDDEPSLPLPAAAAAVEERLVRGGLSAGIARGLVAEVVAHRLPFDPEGELEPLVRAALARRLPVLAGLAPGSRRVAVVGPGGAGKTAACAHLAAAYAAAGAEVVAIALQPPDDGRALAARLTRAPVTVLAGNTAAELTPRMRGLSPGLIVVDTPALSYSNPALRDAIGAELRALGVTEVHVVLPATISGTAAGELLEALAPSGATHVALTHADETGRPGAPVEAALRAGRPVSYLVTAGGIEPADPADLASRLLP